MFLFVYGSLKKNYWNNRLLTTSKYLGKAQSYEKYALYNYSYPFAVHEDNEEVGRCLPITGELYDVDRDIVDRLDRMELGAGYYRATRPVFSNEKGLVQAIMYEYPSPNPFGFSLLCDTVHLDGATFYEWKG